MSISCETCRYWKKLSLKHGLCRGGPPTAGDTVASVEFKDRGYKIISRWGYWPATEPGDWCGTWKRK